VSLLEPGANCWRVDRAARAALVVDAADYYRAARSALLNARSTVQLLNWAFDPDTPFDPSGPAQNDPAEQFGPFLRRLADERPGLDVRILCWRSSLPIAATQHFFPHRAKQCFQGSRVHFRLDASVPLGACHHQKMIVIDEEIAFCGGCDIGPDRWDTLAHLDDEPGRRPSAPGDKRYPPRHEVMAVVEGAPARALGELFRERWRRSTGHKTLPPAERAGDAWPPQITPQFTGTRTAIARTLPEWRGWPEVRECEALHLSAIAAAQRCIYLENQYFTSPIVAEALAARLAEPGGPEVILISTEHSPSWFDRMTMDRTRALFLTRLQAADAHRRLHAYVPRTEHRQSIIVHAKLAIIDDLLLRVGSANLNNRSAGFDTECDLAFEPDPDDGAARRMIAAQRARLLAHWLGCSPAAVAQAAAQAGGLGAGVDRLRADGFDRLSPLSPLPMGPVSGFIATHHLGDPVAPIDSWRPWRRRRALSARLAQAQAAE
jgi:phosphatidylserine/phosphatidylglycerophosphate/cardiolipin synthase-like enzyme